MNNNIFKIGDQVTCINRNMSILMSGGIYTVTGVFPIGGCQLLTLEGFSEATRFRATRFKSKKEFTINDIKNGMRVVYRSGDCRIVLEGHLFGRDFNLVHADFKKFYNDNLSNKEYSGKDIVRVYNAPQLLDDIMNVDIVGDIIFEINETEKKARELFVKAAELKLQYEALIAQAQELTNAKR